MAYGVDNAAVICCFMSPKYEESKNCKKELNYADSVDVEIIPLHDTQGIQSQGMARTYHCRCTLDGF